MNSLFKGSIDGIVSQQFCTNMKMSQIDGTLSQMSQFASVCLNMVKVLNKSQNE